jgi:cytochrome c oxidase assembly protein subunit 15
MVGGIFYEHSHRLLGSVVGLLTIALAATLWFNERRRWLRWLGVAALGLVILQGIMGGLRVVLLQDTLAIVHAALAQAFFALAVALSVFTSRAWRTGSGEATSQGEPRLFRLALITTLLIYCQSLFGAVLRHTGMRLDAHLLFAALVALHVIFIFVRATRASSAPKARRPAVQLLALLAIQLVLGLASYLSKFTTLLGLSVETVVFLTTSHVVAGALMLAASVVVTLQSCSSAPRYGTSRREVLREQFST